MTQLRRTEIKLDVSQKKTKLNVSIASLLTLKLVMCYFFKMFRKKEKLQSRGRLQYKPDS